jgi:argininosuccinate synthase
MMPRVVFACSGAAENIAAIPRLAAEFDAEVVTLTLDVGQGALEAIRQAAIAAGAIRAHVLDAREEFARGCVTATLSDSPAGYSRGHNITCMLIARNLVEMARIEGAGLVAHGGGEEDHAEIETAVRALQPSIRVVRIAAVRAHSPHAVHATLWERPTVDASKSTMKPELDAPARLEIAFRAGLPISVNGIAMSLPELIESVSTIAGMHGVGLVTDTSGTSVHAPAAVVLQAAHGALGTDAARASAATVCLELFKGQHRILSAHHS